MPKMNRRAVALGAHHRLGLKPLIPASADPQSPLHDVSFKQPSTAKVLCGRIGLNRISVRPQKLAGCRTNRRIIVDDGNNWNR